MNLESYHRIIIPTEALKKDFNWYYQVFELSSVTRKKDACHAKKIVQIEDV
jgi:hypothetical protein